jgi:hypothetical protein
MSRRVSALPHLSLAVDEACTDLLLLEEFYASDAFSAWFLARVTADDERWQGATVRHVGRSVVRYGRESDLEVGFEARDGRRLRLLIENKIKAVFQKGQVEAYHDRARRFVEQGECEVALTVLVAPRAYGAADRFDRAVAYEQIRDWYMARKNARARYRARVFQSGIDKAEGQSYSEPDVKVTEFWQRYYPMACEEAPALCMRDPGVRQASGTFVEFNDAPLPRGVLIVHKLTHGFVDVQLKGLGTRLETVRDVLGGRLPEGAEIVRAARSASVRLRVPTISVWDDFGVQMEAVRTGQAAANSLLAWVQSVPDAWGELQRPAAGAVR